MVVDSSGVMLYLRDMKGKKQKMEPVDTTQYKEIVALGLGVEGQRPWALRRLGKFVETLHYQILDLEQKITDLTKQRDEAQRRLDNELYKQAEEEGLLS